MSMGSNDAIENVLHETRTFPPSAEFAAQADFKIIEKDVAAFLKTKISGAVQQLPGLQRKMASTAKALKTTIFGVSPC